MKLIALAAALAFSGAAIAQTAPAGQTAPAATDPAQPVTTVTTATDPATGQSATVVNVASPGNLTSPPPPDPPSSYPPCSRKITDHCRQRGGR
jgi:hypothetical protein